MVWFYFIFSAVITEHAQKGILLDRISEYSTKNHMVLVSIRYLWSDPTMNVNVKSSMLSVRPPVLPAHRADWLPPMQAPLHL